MSEETDTTSPPQHAGFKIPSWAWVAGSALVIGGIVIMILIITGGSSDEDSDERTPGGEKEKEELKTILFSPDGRLVSLRQDSNRPIVETELLVEFVVPNESKQAQELTFAFNRKPPAQSIITALSGPGDFNYLVFDVLDTDKKSAFGLLSLEKLHDFADDLWDFTRAELKFDRSDTPGRSFLDKLKPGFTVKIYMTIYGYQNTGDISDIETKLTYKM